jgi:hypothetical protein
MARVKVASRAVMRECELIPFPFSAEDGWEVGEDKEDDEGDRDCTPPAVASSWVRSTDSVTLIIE